jgi:DNA-binding beta-propeller fold protein YncE
MIELIPDTDTPETPDGPLGLAVSPYGDSLYVVNNNGGTVKVITIADDTVSDTIFMVGNSPVGLGRFFFSEAPSDLTATMVNDYDIDLSWTDNANSETGFTIERRKYTTGIFSAIATVEADVTTYSDIELDPYANYYYRIRADNDAGSTLYSNTDYARTRKKNESTTCFIATAAYGSYWEPHVMTLRQLRDSHLLTKNWGQGLLGLITGTPHQ